SWELPPSPPRPQTDTPARRAEAGSNRLQEYVPAVTCKYSEKVYRATEDIEAAAVPRDSTCQSSHRRIVEFLPAQKKKQTIVHQPGHTPALRQTDRAPGTTDVPEHPKTQTQRSR